MTTLRTNPKKTAGVSAPRAVQPSRSRTEKPVIPTRATGKPVTPQKSAAAKGAVKKVASAPALVVRKKPASVPVKVAAKKLVPEPTPVKVAAKKAAPAPVKVAAKKLVPAPARVVAKKAAPAPVKLVAQPASSAVGRAAESPAERAPAVSFGALGIPPVILAALTARGILSPFPIQALTIPDALAGRDVCGQAKTGSGKTLAFAIPLVAHAANRPLCPPHRPGALVLVPTRELAAQVEREFEWLSSVSHVRVVSIYGGASMDHQREQLRRGTEIVVATPGRLIDLIERGDIDLSGIERLVLDEADRMCDMGFLPNVEWLIRQMGDATLANSGAGRQTLLFSATLGSDVGYITKHYLTDPSSYGVANSVGTVEESHHRFLQVHQLDRIKVLARVVTSFDKALVFTNTKRNCDRLVDDLKFAGVNARAIHGDLAQSQRDRALRQFGEGQVSVLVATDVAARGLHVDDIDVVVQFDPPDDHKTYLHRAGRTARAGASGVVVTFVLWNQLNEVRRLQKRLGMNAGAIPEVLSNDARLADLVRWDPAA